MRGTMNDAMFYNLMQFSLFTREVILHWMCVIEYADKTCFHRLAILWLTFLPL